MERDKVAFSQDFAKGIIFHEVKVGVLINVIAITRIPKAVKLILHIAAPILPVPIIPAVLPWKSKSHKTIQAEIVLSYLYIALVYSSCYCKRRQ